MQLTLWTQLKKYLMTIYHFNEVIQMESMTRLNVDSHFELVSGAALSEKDIVQIWPNLVYKNNAGYAVFLCEVENEKEKGVKNGD